VTPKVFIAIPNTGLVSATVIPGLLQCGACAGPQLGNHSSLPYNFNLLWSIALNQREEVGWTHWAMHHADISAQPGWLAIMLEEMKKFGADSLSCVVPIKQPDVGLTSTGMYYPDLKDTRRLTIYEAHELPETFGEEEVRDFFQCPDGILVVNTGLWLCDFTKPWVEDVHFAQPSRIFKTMVNGKKVFKPWFLPEDWRVSRYFKKIGLKVMATRKVSLAHDGVVGFSADTPWGDNFDVEFIERHK
jgi:hypothetical protein